jgi:integrase
VRVAISIWLTGDERKGVRKVSPKTIRNRLVALAALFHLLDRAPGEARTPPSPTDGISIEVRKRRPTYVRVETIRAVVENLKRQEQSKTGKARGRLLDPKTRARFMVIAATGIRPSMLKRVTPDDVDLERRTVTIAAGKGGEPIGFYLNDDMLAAWEVFVEADAWGEYDTRSAARVLRTAGWPAHVRPYNARHAVGQDLSEQGEDLQDIADWMGHADPETTRRFYVPILTGRMRAMSERLNGCLGWVPQNVPQPTPDKGGKSRKNVSVPAQPVQRKRADSVKKSAR